MSVYTNKEEKKEYGKVLTSLLKKQFPFILDVDVYGLESTGFFNIDCYLIVPKDFILGNIKSNNDRRLNFGIREGVIPTFLFNDNSKRLKFNTEEFLKLCRLLFMSMFGEISDGNTYSVQFKMV